MEITYKRELKHNYLIITPEEAFYDSYVYGCWPPTALKAS